MSFKGPRPLFMRRQDIVGFYKVDNRRASTITKKLTPVGHYLGEDLFSRADVEAQIKEKK